MIIFLCIIIKPIYSTSKYIGVSSEKENNTWRVVIYVGKEAKFGGRFDNELDAAKRVNQMCDEFKLERKNPEVNGIPNLKRLNKWRATIYVKRKAKYGGFLKVHWKQLTE